MARTLFASALAIVLVGCGASGEVPDRADKEVISAAALMIAVECLGGDADPSTVEDQVTALLAEGEEAGDERFTLSDSFADVTVSDILRDRAALMRRERCAPPQTERLIDEAGAPRDLGPAPFEEACVAPPGGDTRLCGNDAVSWCDNQHPDSMAARDAGCARAYQWLEQSS